MRKKPATSLRARALQYLARREHSRAELRAKLLPHAQADDGFDAPPPQDVDVLLDDLAARGWLSDQRAASQLVHAKRSRYGMQRIIHELRQKGIGEEIISDELATLGDSEAATARDVWERKFGTPPCDAKEKARQIRFLQSRGFSMQTIIRLMRDAGQPLAEDDL
ncbi:MAG: recombination regulator RecX [Gallionella sp.]|nr:recombination regulator RecX [Gallionella sp.]